jgi:hypothetical protein
MLQKLITLLKKEMKRIIPMLLIAAMILIPDAGSFVVLYSIGITIALGAVSHIMRKLLFPYVNLKDLAFKAMESPIGAGMVFFSITLLLAVFVIAGVVLLG